MSPASSPASDAADSGCTSTTTTPSWPFTPSWFAWSGVSCLASALLMPRKAWTFTSSSLPVFSSSISGRDGVDLDGEAEVLGVGDAGGVDADHLAGGVEERAARVAVVDGRVGLHQVLQRVLRRPAACGPWPRRSRSSPSVCHRAPARCRWRRPGRRPASQPTSPGSPAPAWWCRAGGRGRCRGSGRCRRGRRGSCARRSAGPGSRRRRRRRARWSAPARRRR